MTKSIYCIIVANVFEGVYRFTECEAEEYISKLPESARYLRYELYSEWEKDSKRVFDILKIV